MTRVLVTGGTGVLGREMVERLANIGYMVRVISRRHNTLPAHAEWTQGDLLNRAGLIEALTGVDVVVHAASSPFKRTWQIDVEGTRRLLEAARAANVRHIVYISIVGIEQVPYPYYRAKLAAEELVRASTVPWSILRATQFHNLIDSFLQQVNRLPLFLLPTDFQYQPIDVSEVAVRLVECVAAGPGGRLADIGGPEVLGFGNLARAWLEARRLKRHLIHLPLPGRFATTIRQGHLTCPDQRFGRTTWADWLVQHYARQETAMIS